VLLAKHYYCDYINKHEKVGTRNMQVRNGKFTQNFGKKTSIEETILGRGIKSYNIKTRLKETRCEGLYAMDSTNSLVVIRKFVN
jgi:hypothetical protein